MDGTTRCPHCDTRFKIAAAQLQAHQGQVRCGQCLQAFDARLEFISDEPHPQLELHELVANAPAPVTAPPSLASSLDFSQPVPTELHGEERVVAMPADAAPVTKRGRAGLLIALLVLGLLLQLAYVWRADLAARLPASKPLLQTVCTWLSCTVGLPQSSELISIESSNLEADPNNSQLISLNVLLRNRANYALALPQLELTLNDSQERPMARRIFKPTEYLSVPQTADAGVAANQEINIKVWLELRGLNPSGYRLVLIYPNS
ncbi:MAG: zinc-ribbon and DUF3426 domain-containing protein [Sideroxydans sp.]|nr:zinc-ribbon and DUF3426 domain-containing protein [Sideroxydans sp.]